MLMPKNLRELIESLESLVSFSRCNAALTHLPIDELLENMLEGDFKGSLESMRCLVEPVRQKSPQAAEDLEKIINGELSLAKSLPRMLECLRHVQPNTAEAFQCEVIETETGWNITLDGEEDV
jgi:hypothetical protein